MERAETAAKFVESMKKLKNILIEEIELIRNGIETKVKHETNEIQSNLIDTLIKSHVSDIEEELRTRVEIAAKLTQIFPVEKYKMMTEKIERFISKTYEMIQKISSDKRNILSNLDIKGLRQQTNPNSKFLEMDQKRNILITYQIEEMDSDNYLVLRNNFEILEDEILKKKVIAVKIFSYGNSDIDSIKYILEKLSSKENLQSLYLYVKDASALRYKNLLSIFRCLPRVKYLNLKLCNSIFISQLDIARLVDEFTIFEKNSFALDIQNYYLDNTFRKNVTKKLIKYSLEKIKTCKLLSFNKCSIKFFNHQAETESEEYSKAIKELKKFGISKLFKDLNREKEDFESPINKIKSKLGLIVDSNLLEIKNSYSQILESDLVFLKNFAVNTLTLRADSKKLEIHFGAHEKISKREFDKSFLGSRYLKCQLLENFDSKISKELSTFTSYFSSLQSIYLSFQQIDFYDMQFLRALVTDNQVSILDINFYQGCPFINTELEFLVALCLKRNTKLFIQIKITQDSEIFSRYSKLFSFRDIEIFKFEDSIIIMSSQEYFELNYKNLTEYYSNLNSHKVSFNLSKSIGNREISYVKNWIKYSTNFVFKGLCHNFFECINYNDASSLKKLTNLRLQLDGQIKIGLEIFHELDVPNLADLSIKAIDFKDSSNILLCKILKSLKYLPTLKNFEFECQSHKINNETLKAISLFLTRVKSLLNISLDISESNLIDFDGVKSFSSSLAELSNLKTIYLNFSKCSKIKDAALDILFSSLLNLKSIVNLNFNLSEKSNSITDKSIITLSKSLKNLKLIKSLTINLNNCSLIKNEGIISLSDAFKNLNLIENLDLSLSSLPILRDEGIQYLAKSISKMLALQNLDFKISNISNLTNQSLIEISQAIKKLNYVSHLNLDFADSSSITDKGISELSSALEQIKSLRSLELHFEFCSLISDEGISDLTKALKNLIELSSFSLHFYRCDQITDKSVHDISLVLKEIKKIKILNLHFFNCTSLSNNGLLELSEAIQSSNCLNSLTLNFSDIESISNNGLISLSKAIGSLNSIETLNLQFFNCINLGDEGIGSLSKALTDVPQITNLILNFESCSNISNTEIESFKLNLIETDQRLITLNKTKI